MTLYQSLGRVARSLERTGEPILLKLRSRPVGVIVSLRDFRERFARKAAAEERRRMSRGWMSWELARAGGARIAAAAPPSGEAVS
jgi:hypothetical protein